MDDLTLGDIVNISNEINFTMQDTFNDLLWFIRTTMENTYHVASRINPDVVLSTGMHPEEMY